MEYAVLGVLCIAFIYVAYRYIGSIIKMRKTNKKAVRYENQAQNLTTLSKESLRDIKTEDKADIIAAFVALNCPEEESGLKDFFSETTLNIYYTVKIEEIVVGFGFNNYFKACEQEFLKKLCSAYEELDLTEVAAALKQAKTNPNYAKKIYKQSSAIITEKRNEYIKQNIEKIG